MKKVNFISPLPPHKQYELRRWFWFTALLWGMSFAVGIYFFVPQLVTFIGLRKEISALRDKTKSYSEIVTKKDALKTESESLSVRGGRINKYAEQPKNPHRYIAVILEASGNGAKIEALKFNKKDVELTIVCPTSEHATVFIKRLSVSDLFAGIKLISLQHEVQANQFRAVIKGNVVF